MRRLILPVAAASALLIPAAAQAQAPLMTKREAVAFVRQYWVPVSSRLLRDERATFYRPAAAKLHATRRVSRSTVDVRYRIRLQPDAAHRRAHWWPIVCRGVTRNTERRDGSMVGRPLGYRCVTVRP